MTNPDPDQKYVRCACKQVLKWPQRELVAEDLVPPDAEYLTIGIASCEHPRPSAKTTLRFNVEDVLTRLDKLEGDVVNLHKLLADALDALNGERAEMLRSFAALQRLVTQALPAQGHS